MKWGYVPSEVGSLVTAMLKGYRFLNRIDCVSIMSTETSLSQERMQAACFDAPGSSVDDSVHTLTRESDAPVMMMVRVVICS